ncbi:MAG: ABC transporter permease [Desulfobacteraceae bacterium]|nr:ABC transporter permease [Desulfobacteraceae bacterium]
METLNYTLDKTEKKSLIRQIWDLAGRSTFIKLGVFIMLIFGGMAVLSPIWIQINPAIYDPIIGVDLSVNGSVGPSFKHPLGTDDIGKDLFSQLLRGSQVAFILGIMVSLISTTLGTTIGLFAGYYGKISDTLLMRLADIILTVPILPLLIVISGIFGTQSNWIILLILSFTFWPVTARVIRAQTLSLRERPFIESAKVSGISNTRIIVKHLAPNVLPIAFYYLTVTVTGAILVEAGLSFLGFGDPSNMSWGMMLQWCFVKGYVFKAPYWMIPPGLCISLLSFSFYLIGVGLEEIVNPRLKKR